MLRGQCPLTKSSKLVDSREHLHDRAAFLAALCANKTPVNKNLPKAAVPDTQRVELGSPHGGTN